MVNYWGWNFQSEGIWKYIISFIFDWRNIISSTQLTSWQGFSKCSTNLKLANIQRAKSLVTDRCLASVPDRYVPPGVPVSSTNNTDCHNMTSDVESDIKAKTMQSMLWSNCLLNHWKASFWKLSVRLNILFIWTVHFRPTKRFCSYFTTMLPDCILYRKWWSQLPRGLFGWMRALWSTPGQKIKLYILKSLKNHYFNINVIFFSFNAFAKV